ncbi:RelA/SpoT domain-containing protein [Vibrio splendidus]|nr:RelA/SpoT domain-containing protein [Vibrio splendidus]
MANQQYENQKVTLRYTKNEIDRAARSIRHGCEAEEREEAINKIQNYRELHAYPLMLMKNHLVRTSNRVSSDILVARRLKRLPTIINKLERPSLDGTSKNAIKLTRMQDIGGCRAIVKNLKQLKELQQLLLKSRSVHKITHTSDYLTPKISGYGGVHLIYSCFNDSDCKHNWSKTKVEVQLRTQLQHAWATSLEIIDTLEQIELKTSMGGACSLA